MAFRTAGVPEGPVGSGIDCFIMQDNTQLSYSTDMSIDEDTMIEGVQTLGYYGNRDFLSMGYDVRFSLGTFLLRGADVAGNLSIPGWSSDGVMQINTAGLYTFTALDVHTLTVLFTLMGCKYGGGNLNVAQGALMKRGTNWRARQLLPGLQTS